MKTKIQALVLSVSEYKDKDGLVKVLTTDSILTLYARGLFKQNSKNLRLVQPFSYNELNVRVKALLRRYHVYQGKKEEAKAIIRLNDLEIDQEHKEVYLNKNKLSLTDIEYEILDYLVLNRKQVISASQLFETIWHENYYYGANNTIMVHIRNLRKKIEEDPQNPRIIKTVWGKGYYIDYKELEFINENCFTTSFFSYACCFVLCSFSRKCDRIL